jgi:transposase-like protein
MFVMPKPYPQEFREDVIRVARNREPGVRITETSRRTSGSPRRVCRAALTRADRDDGVRPGPTSDELADLREAKKRIRVLEQENEVLRRAAAYCPRRTCWEMMFLLVREPAVDGIPVTVTYRVLKSCRQQYYRSLDQPVTDGQLDEAWLANAIFDAHEDDPEFRYRFLADEVRFADHDVSVRPAPRRASAPACAQSSSHAARPLRIRQPEPHSAKCRGWCRGRTASVRASAEYL